MQTAVASNNASAPTSKVYDGWGEKAPSGFEPL